MTESVSLETSNTPPTPRWHYRFTNFKKAYILLQESTENISNLNQLEHEGVIRRFKYCTELAWKTIRDYLEHEDVTFAQLTPRAVLKEAIAFNFLTHGQTWLDILDDRNKMAHTYNVQHFRQVVHNIATQYINCFSDLYEKLHQEILEHE